MDSNKKDLFQTFKMLWCGIGTFGEELNKWRRHGKVARLVLQEAGQVGAWVQVDNQQLWKAHFNHLGRRKAVTHRCRRGRGFPSLP